MNIVTRGTEPLAPVTVTLQDVLLEGVLDHVSAAAELSWQMGRFGIVTLSPRK